MSDDSDDKKKLLTEVLPDPKASGDPRSGSPRERTRDHLRKLLAGAAGLAMTIPGLAGADVTPPPSGDGNNGKKKPPERQPDAPKPPNPGYLVVDPVPRPPDDAGKPGYVGLTSTPDGAHITIDGNDSGMMTPQKKVKLAPGFHTITLSHPGYQPESFTVQITPELMVPEHHTLKRVADAKKGEKGTSDRPREKEKKK